MRLDLRVELGMMPKSGLAIGHACDPSSYGLGLGQGRRFGVSKVTT